MISAENKSKVIAGRQRNKTDTGSPEVQVGILTARIKELTAHLKVHKLDQHSRRGLLQMVGARKRHLAYLRQHDFEAYQKLIRDLKLRS
jgi:small subunit ribosomal protein S15